MISQVFRVLLGQAEYIVILKQHFLNTYLFIYHYSQFNLLIIVFTDTIIFMSVHFKTCTREFTK
jgi:uncharacterized membrane protein